ncbi:MAG: hypothetical protein R2759_03565 [Bacteroidales bacterium]
MAKAGAGSRRCLSAGKADGKQNRGFRTAHQSDAIREIMKADTTVKDGNFDINNYKFDSESAINWKFTDIGVPLPGQGNADEDGPPKRLNYNVEYFINQIVTQIDFLLSEPKLPTFFGQEIIPYTWNPGFNALFQIESLDLFEDYRISGGVRLNLNSGQ